MHFHPRLVQIIILSDAKLANAHASTDGPDGYGSQHGLAAVASDDAKPNESDERPKLVYANDDGEPDASEWHGDEPPAAADDAEYDDEHESGDDASDAGQPAVELRSKEHERRLERSIRGRLRGR